MRPIYIVLCGLSGSGKSTLRQEIVKAFDGELVTLSTDDTIERCAAERNTTYTAAFPDYIKYAEEVLNRAREFGIKNRLNMIHDQTNLSVKSRAKRIGNLPKDYIKVCLYLHVDTETLDQRLANRPGKVLMPNVTAAQKLMWQEPGLIEGFDVVASGDLWKTNLRDWIKCAEPVFG